MEYRRLGNSGLQVSLLGLGTNAFGKRSDEQASTRIIHAALDSGINFIDTANIYAGTESERIIGKALAGRRQEAVLTTKAGLPPRRGAKPLRLIAPHLQRELDESLRRLQTDYVDLYQIHTFDPNTPLEETLRTLDDMVRSGKVRYIGASNYAAWELMKALGISDKLGLNRFISIQTSYSLADRTPESEMVPLAKDQGVGIIPYFPLAGGILTGKYLSAEQMPQGSRALTDPSFKRFFAEKNLQLGQDVAELAAKLGCTPAALSLRWLMQQQTVSTVIVGATNEAQVLENSASLTLELDQAAIAELNRISDRFRFEPFAAFPTGEIKAQHTARFSRHAAKGAYCLKASHP